VTAEAAESRERRWVCGARGWACGGGCVCVCGRGCAGAAVRGWVWMCVCGGGRAGARRELAWAAHPA
jgi:hypothetical protein